MNVLVLRKMSNTVIDVCLYFGRYAVMCMCSYCRSALSPLYSYIAENVIAQGPQNATFPHRPFTQVYA